ncbi:hypothetical protein PoB_001417200 [Plakobranchus ocellatus]|uniref:CXXC-type domain-containing protein n=1 Tax=Plakobranchus ocellatus TaxID=259542 RepID=A0AAV3YZN5_9GAST|nr:hypothetical protein PoB_001417200 [Plakobranchus ocellatus]
MSAAFHGPPMHVPPHHLHHHNLSGTVNNSNHHHHHTSSNSNNSGIVSGSGAAVDTNGNGGYMLDDGSGVVGGVGYPHDGMTPPGMVWDPSLQGDGGGKFRLKRRRRCGQCAPCQVKENCNKCQYCMRKDVLKQACIYRKCVYLRKPVPRFRQDAPPPSNGAASPCNGINKPPTTPPRKNNNNNNNSSNNNNNINGVASSTPAPNNCNNNSNGSSHNNSVSNGGNNSSGNPNPGPAATNGVSTNSGSSTSGSSGTPLHHTTLSAPSSVGTSELSSCRLNQSPFGANVPGANGVVLDPLRHRSMMDAHYPHHHRPPGGPSFFDPMATQLSSTTSPHHPQHDLTPAAAAAAAVAAAAAGNTMGPHHPASHLNPHSQSAKMISPTSSSAAATTRDAAAAATTYFPHPAESWGSAVPYAAFPRAPSWAASAYGFQQHSSPFASSFTPSSFPPSPFAGSSCRLSLPDSGSSSSSASRYGPTAASATQHPFHHTMPGISGFSTGDALSHAQYSHHAHHPHAHSNMRSSFYAPAHPSGHHLGSSSTLPGFPSLAAPSFGPSPYHPHPHSHMYPGSFYSSLRAATEPQIYHVQYLPSENPFRLALEQTCSLLDSLDNEKGCCVKNSESSLLNTMDMLKSKPLLSSIGCEVYNSCLNLSAIQKEPASPTLKGSKRSLEDETDSTRYSSLGENQSRTSKQNSLPSHKENDLFKAATEKETQDFIEKVKTSNIPIAPKDKQPLETDVHVDCLESVEFCQGFSLLQEEVQCFVVRDEVEILNREDSEGDDFTDKAKGSKPASYCSSGDSDTVGEVGQADTGCVSTTTQEGEAMQGQDLNTNYYQLETLSEHGTSIETQLSRDSESSVEVELAHTERIIPEPNSSSQIPINSRQPFSSTSDFSPRPSS